MNVKTLPHTANIFFILSTRSLTKDLAIIYALLLFLTFEVLLFF